MLVMSCFTNFWFLKMTMKKCPAKDDHRLDTLTSSSSSHRHLFDSLASLLPVNKENIMPGEK